MFQHLLPNRSGTPRSRLHAAALGVLLMLGSVAIGFAILGMFWLLNKLPEPLPLLGFLTLIAAFGTVFGMKCLR